MRRCFPTVYASYWRGQMPELTALQLDSVFMIIFIDPDGAEIIYTEVALAPACSFQVCAL